MVKKEAFEWIINKLYDVLYNFKARSHSCGGRNGEGRSLADRIISKARALRASTFIQRYRSNTVVELDAMPPKLLQEIVLETVIPYLDVDEVERLQNFEQRIKTEGAEAPQSLIDLEE